MIGIVQGKGDRLGSKQWLVGWNTLTRHKNCSGTSSPPSRRDPKDPLEMWISCTRNPEVQVKNLNFSSFFSVHTCSWVNAITVQTTTLGTLQHIWVISFEFWQSAICLFHSLGCITVLRLVIQLTCLAFGCHMNIWFLWTTKGSCRV